MSEVKLQQKNFNLKDCCCLLEVFFFNMLKTYVAIRYDDVCFGCHFIHKSKLNNSTPYSVLLHASHVCPLRWLLLTPPLPGYCIDAECNRGFTFSTLRMSSFVIWPSKMLHICTSGLVRLFVLRSSCNDCNYHASAIFVSLSNTLLFTIHKLIQTTVFLFSTVTKLVSLWYVFALPIICKETPSEQITPSTHRYTRARDRRLKLITVWRILYKWI